MIRYIEESDKEAKKKSKVSSETDWKPTKGQACWLLRSLTTNSSAAQPALRIPDHDRRHPLQILNRFFPWLTLRRTLWDDGKLFMPAITALLHCANDGLRLGRTSKCCFPARKS